MQLGVSSPSLYGTKEIIEYLRENQKAYPSDVADALQLDFDLVLDIVKELVKEGRVK